MKKRLAFLTAVVLALALGAALAEPAAVPADEPYVYEDSFLGFSFPMPAAWVQAFDGEGQLQAIQEENGVLFSFAPKAALERLDALNQSIEEAGVADYSELTPEQLQAIDQINGMLAPVCFLRVQGEANQGVYSALTFTDEIALGEAGGSTYSLQYDKQPELSQLPDEDKRAFTALHAQIEKLPEVMTLTGMEKAPEITGAVAFDSKGLDGAPISSGVFKDYKLTAVNIWATWCGYCVDEMPELQKLYESLPADTNLISICTDALDEPELAQRIVDETGVKFPVVVVENQLDMGFLMAVTGYPTTLFVDSEGNLVGDPIVGVPSLDNAADAYRQAIEERLRLLGE